MLTLPLSAEDINNNAASKSLEAVPQDVRLRLQ